MILQIFYSEPDRRGKVYLPYEYSLDNRVHLGCDGIFEKILSSDRGRTNFNSIRELLSALSKHHKFYRLKKDRIKIVSLHIEMNINRL